MNETIMDGVWIINVNQEAAATLDTLHIFLGAFIGIVIGTGILCLIFWALSDLINIDGDFLAKVIILVLIMFGLIGAFVSLAASDDTTTGDVTYDVLIGDNVSFNEFNERYEIISQNGSIYTVKEKIK